MLASPYLKAPLLKPKPIALNTPETKNNELSLQV